MTPGPQGFEILYRSSGNLFINRIRALYRGNRYMAYFFETLMLICFGISWPFNIVKSYRSRTAKGKSILFELCIIVGYLCGLVGKLIGNNISYVVVVYLLDIFMVATDLALTFRNCMLDRRREN